MSIVQQLKFSLPSWVPILAACIEGKESIPIDSLAYFENFIDGFMINVGKDTNSAQVKRILTDHGLEVKNPHSK